MTSNVVVVNTGPYDVYVAELESLHGGHKEVSKNHYLRPQMATPNIVLYDGKILEVAEVHPNLRHKEIT